MLTKGRCYKCVENLVGTESYKEGRENLNNKLKTKCRVCLEFICKMHQHKLEYICECCMDK